jgi:hypothetical protein
MQPENQHHSTGNQKPVRDRALRLNLRHQAVDTFFRPH